MSEATRNTRRGVLKFRGQPGAGRHGRRLLALAAASAIAMIAGTPKSAQAVTSIWNDSNVSGSPFSPMDWFSGGTNIQGSWSTNPVNNDNTAIIQFFDGAALGNNAAAVQTSNINDGGVAVQLGTLILSGNAANTLTETISGDPLNFSSNVGTITLSGSAKITYNLNSQIDIGTFPSALTIGGNGAGTFNIGGSIVEQVATAGIVTKTGTSTVTLSGFNVYTGGTNINAGTVVFANTNSFQNTGTITVAGGATAQLNFGTGAGTFVTHLTNTSAGLVAFKASTSDNLDFTNAGTVSLNLVLVPGSLHTTNVTLSGTITPNAQTYRFGAGTFSNYETLTVSSVLADSGGATGLIMKQGANLSLSNVANTYSGPTTIASIGIYPGEQLSVAKLANGGSTSSIGQSSNAAQNLILNNGLLNYTGSTAASTDRLFTIGGGNAQIQTNSQPLTFSNTTGAIAFMAPGVASSLTFSVQGTITFKPQIIDNTGNPFKTSVTESGNNGAELQLLNPNNNFTGSMSVNQNGGILTVTHLADGGQPSSIGASTSAAGNLNLRSNGQQNGPLNLKYVGTGDSTNRQMTIGLNTNSSYNANTFIFDNEGTGPLVMSGNPVVVIGNNGTPAQDTLAAGLTLTANTASGVNQFNGVVSNTTGTVQPLGINKLGLGTWSLGNPASPGSTTDTYTGPTTVSAGTLLMNASILSSITVNANSTLGGSGTTTGSVELKSLSILSPGNSGPGKFTVSSLQLDSGSATKMEIGGPALGTQYDNVTASTNSPFLTYNGTLQIVSFGSYNVASQPGSYTLFAFTGPSTSDFSSVTVDGFALTDASGVWTGTNGPATYTFTNSTGTLTVAPEPASLAIMLCGGVGLLMRRRQTRRARVGATAG